MKTYMYSSHSISRCTYIYPILNVNVESEYIKSSSGFSKVSMDLAQVPEGRIIQIPLSDKHEATGESLQGYFETEFTLNYTWNVLVVVDQSKTPMSLIYDTYSLNTREVDTIHLKYIIDYKSNSITATLNIGTEYAKHMAEYVGTNMQPIPKMFSRTSEYSILNWSDNDFNMSYDSDNSIVDDHTSTYDYILKANLNSIPYNSGSKYYLTGTTQDMFVIKVDSSDTATLYPLNNQPNNLSTSIPLHNVPTQNISHIELVENGYGIILVDTSDNIYYCTALHGRPQWNYSDWTQVTKPTGYSIIIPTFIDLCGCYVKIPDPRTKTPTAYEVKKWTGLFNESATYGDRIYAEVYNYPVEIPAGDVDMKTGYWESLGLANTKTFFRSSGVAQNSPVAMHQFEVMDPLEGNSVALDMNIRCMVALYVDLLNSDRLDKIIIPRDCGLEIVNETGGNDFITYLGDHYRLPQGAQIMNMSYLLNNTVVDLIDWVQDEDSYSGDNILSAKYGVVLTQSMLTGV